MAEKIINPASGMLNKNLRRGLGKGHDHPITWTAAITPVMAKKAAMCLRTIMGTSVI
jgi:hypothetical protein